MKFTSFIIILSFYSFIGFGQQQNVDIKLIHDDFTTDSLGCSGLRLKHINTSTTYFDTLTKTIKTKVLISGLDLKNQDENTIMELLGKANSTSHRSEGFYYFDNYWFYLTTCANNKSVKTLLVTVFNGLIDDVIIQDK